MSAPETQQAPFAYEQLLRELAPQVLGAVVRRYGDFSAAEDAVQESLLVAAQSWPREGLPERPRAWLIQVAARRLTDQIRAESARRRRETTLVNDALPEDQWAPAPDSEQEPEKDDSLVLLLMCCHPALTRTSAIALTLRAVAGLTTAEIARAFLVPEATMAQRISRAKQLIKSSGVGFAMPSEAERDARFAAALHVVYLIFNEGYAASSGDSLQRVDLSTEAIRLGRLVLRVQPDHAEAAGLLALMLLTDARRRARSGPDGELIPLDEQNRSLWDRDAITEGVELVSRALRRGEVGPYQLQAAIAACHDEAASAAATDWPQILALYGVLQQMSDNPMLTLNRAVAVAMVHGPNAGLELLASLDADARIAQHHRLAAVRGHLHEKAGNISAAITCFQNAAARTASTPERNYLLMKAARLRDRSN
ncbi:MAG TPA: sigma-70 family RNA polymerase sigma factor [Polyangiaceae bacterium]|nr:sigma-70 family RNA polymerase sigma factor [Polyangiaceae bacterium]